MGARLLEINTEELLGEFAFQLTVFFKNAHRFVKMISPLGKIST